MDKDILIQVTHATDLRLEERSWHYYDEWMNTPGDEYTARPGESVDEWNARMQALMDEHGVDSLPLEGWKPQWKKNPEWYQQIAQTNGMALAQPHGWKANWMYVANIKSGCACTAPGTPVTWVMHLHPRQTTTIEALADGTGVRVTLGEKRGDLHRYRPRRWRCRTGRDSTRRRRGSLDRHGNRWYVGTIPHQPLSGALAGNLRLITSKATNPARARRRETPSALNRLHTVQHMPPEPSVAPGACAMCQRRARRSQRIAGKRFSVGL